MPDGSTSVVAEDNVLVSIESRALYDQETTSGAKAAVSAKGRGSRIVIACGRRDTCFVSYERLTDALRGLAATHCRR